MCAEKPQDAYDKFALLFVDRLNGELIVCSRKSFLVHGVHSSDRLYDPLALEAKEPEARTRWRRCGDLLLYGWGQGRGRQRLERVR